MLTPKQMLQILPIALAQVKACNLSEKVLNGIFIVSRKRNYQKSIQQYNKFNKVIKHNGYYIYEF